MIQDDDIYGADRLTKDIDEKDLGLIAHDTGWEIQHLWWNSETQSNWRDGMVRTTLLLEHPDFLPKVEAYIEHILATQDEDGYLGIYTPDLRFNFTQENGELWAQASLFRVLLGYYEATGDDSILKAIERAVATTMRAYPLRQAHPFTIEEEFCGVSHGLTFTDTLDRLAQLTGEEAYLEYALWLYEEFSTNQLSQEDIQAAQLLDPDYRFQTHGVHTYEHLRTLLTAVYASGNPQLEAALAGYVAKLEPCLTPSGGPIGDEFIGGRDADAAETGYEYCSSRWNAGPLIPNTPASKRLVSVGSPARSSRARPRVTGGHHLGGHRLVAPRRGSGRRRYLSTFFSAKPTRLCAMAALRCAPKRTSQLVR